MLGGCNFIDGGGCDDDDDINGGGDGLLVKENKNGHGFLQSKGLCVKAYSFVLSLKPCK